MDTIHPIGFFFFFLGQIAGAESMLLALITWGLNGGQQSRNETLGQHSYGCLAKTLEGFKMAEVKETARWEASGTFPKESFAC